MFQKMAKRINNKKGFTLMELIVVIAILAILAVIAIPRLGGFRNDAESSANNATARTIASAVTMAEADAVAKVNADGINSFLDGIEVKEGTSSDENKWTVEIEEGQIKNIWAPGNSDSLWPIKD